MNLPARRHALAAAVAAARAAGALMRRNLRSAKVINDAQRFDIKLELDVRCQKLIERTLLRAYPTIPVLGEEGTRGDENADWRWVVDPIDGTVNFTYGIPHCCVSIALQRRNPVLGARRRRDSRAWRDCPDADYETVAGVVYDPFCEEVFSAIQGQRARLNGRPIRVSRHTRLNEAIVSMGFSKNVETLRVGLPLFNRLIPRVRKMRMMGAAALGVAYVAAGRFDAYLELNIRLWDIAAGALILECAGGEAWHEPTGPGHQFRLKASNGQLRRALDRV